VLRPSRWVGSGGRLRGWVVRARWWLVVSSSGAGSCMRQRLCLHCAAESSSRLEAVGGSPSAVPELLLSPHLPLALAPPPLPQARGRRCWRAQWRTARTRASSASSAASWCRSMWERCATVLRFRCSGGISAECSRRLGGRRSAAGVWGLVWRGG